MVMLWGLTINSETQHIFYEAIVDIRTPSEDTQLHYDVVSYLKRNYPDVINYDGLGENQITNFIKSGQ